jgi:hypothetical protein
LRSGLFPIALLLLYTFLFFLPACLQQSLGAQHYEPTSPQHITQSDQNNQSGQSEEKDPDYCQEIIKLLTPERGLPLKLTTYLNARKDLSGEGTFITETPLNYGIRLEIPIIDGNERYKLKKEALSSTKQARGLLEDYLELRTEVEYLSSLLAWLWIRVDYGVEYRKNVWPKQIELTKKKAKLKALIAQLRALGVEDSLLSGCYFQTYNLSRHGGKP